MAEEQPTQKDLSTEDMWDLNRKLMTAGEMFDQRALGHNLKGDVDGHTYDGRIENLNQKVVADAQAQAIFWQNIQERSLAAKLASQELLERQQNFWQTMRERQDQHSDQRAHVSTLDNIDYNKVRDLQIIGMRTIEPTREENIADAQAAAVQQGVETVANQNKAKKSQDDLFIDILQHPNANWDANDRTEDQFCHRPVIEADPIPQQYQDVKKDTVQRHQRSRHLDTHHPRQ